MKTAWDYTTLAQSYLKRPDYAPDAIDKMLRLGGLAAGAKICDVGAGVGHLTLPLLARGFHVTPVEPNDAMRNLGAKRTRANYPGTHWHEGTGEETGQPAGAYDMVTFGSSFNVTDRAKALRETARILKPRAWFACMWNHRDLDEPLQAQVEALIKSHIPEYGYGTRREDQTAVIRESGLFQEPKTIEGAITHRVSAGDWIEAWQSHATLQRQAGSAFPAVIAAIRAHLDGTIFIDVPYTTRIWVAQRKE